MSERHDQRIQRRRVCQLQLREPPVAQRLPDGPRRRQLDVQRHRRHCRQRQQPGQPHRPHGWANPMPPAAAHRPPICSPAPASASPSTSAAAGPILPCLPRKRHPVTAYGLTISIDGGAPCSFPKVRQGIRAISSAWGWERTAAFSVGAGYHTVPSRTPPAAAAPRSASMTLASRRSTACSMTWPPRAPLPSVPSSPT